MSGVKKNVQAENGGLAQVTNKDLKEEGRGPMADDTSGGETKTETKE